jgi:hypothetical protein
MLQELAREELLFIDGGHNGDSYRAGKAFGKALSNSLLQIFITPFFSKI